MPVPQSRVRRTHSESSFSHPSSRSERSSHSPVPASPDSLPMSPSSVLSGSTAYTTSSRYQPLTPHGMPKSPKLNTKGLSPTSHRFDPEPRSPATTAYTQPSFVSELHISPVSPERTILPRLTYMPKRSGAPRSRSESRSPHRARHETASCATCNSSLFKRISDKVRRIKLQRVPKKKSPKPERHFEVERVQDLHWSEL
ncbi:hypothetical protein EJ05DRAFT_509098 [Pseudovirgaria hyperparasitica]|uniref:Uncharacterized protein n=1 Tax=Pseudovirgaria hyperparasitica TaxID=470096 RepID=A0A6A6WG31_9PEZI|nr:uncharacterized protein EJ05DRAFT_509098 [Pseudovirgaria hyperparasitica]KAF2760577.1 hypothetical protein EJ05DRAFT_509098 [Pseudovirgaria hyperparasitica]